MTSDRLSTRLGFLFPSILFSSSLLAAPSGSWAQAIAQPTPVPALAPSSSSRISINVVVDDKLGHPISGLKAEDFTRRIQSFETHCGGWTPMTR